MIRKIIRFINSWINPYDYFVEDALKSIKEYKVPLKNILK